MTSVLAIATLLAAALKLDSNVSLLFVFVLGRVYGCTFVYNLNIRAHNVNFADLTPTVLGKGAANEVRTVPDIERGNGSAAQATSTVCRGPARAFVTGTDHFPPGQVDDEKESLRT